MDPHTLEKLEFNRVRELLAMHASCSLGKDRALKVLPSRRAAQAAGWLDQLRQMRELVIDRGMPPFAGIRDVREMVLRTLPPSPLEPADYAAICETLKGLGDLRNYFADLPAAASAVAPLAQRLGDFGVIAQRIEQVIDERGQVRDKASDKLYRIRVTIAEKLEEIRRVFDRLLRQQEILKYLQYSSATFHDDRMVLPLRSEQRGRVPGIVHRSSDSGRTLFIEPAEAVELNNAIIDLRMEEQKEIGRILWQLAHLIHLNQTEILNTIDAASIIDLVVAKVRYGNAFDMCVPTLGSGHKLQFVQARHPLLLALRAQEALAKRSKRLAEKLAAGTDHADADNRPAEIAPIPPRSHGDARSESPVQRDAAPRDLGPPAAGSGRDRDGAHRGERRERRPYIRNPGIVFERADHDRGRRPPSSPVPSQPPQPTAATSPRRGQAHSAAMPAVEHDPDAVVPIDVRLGDDFDMLVITGPNTGGKTAALKTVGLIAAMALSGLPVPARSAILPILDDILIDVGDEQSLQQSLSTFSAHMARVMQVLERANNRTLVLLDELGAGTDPDEGAALGGAVVEELLSRGCLTIVTTHLGALKALPFQRARAENASVEFDVATLRPTYVLRIGEPGESNALLIARRLGLPRSIIQRAEEHLSGQRRALSQAIRGTVEVRRKAEEARRAADDAAQRSAQEAESLRRQTTELQERTRRFELWSSKIQSLRPGDKVKLKRFDREGTVVRVKLTHQQVVVNVGAMEVEVPLTDIEVT